MFTVFSVILYTAVVLIALLLILAFILSLSCAALAENKLEKILSIGEITFATSPDFAPSEFINPNATGDDQYVGADVELAKYIAQGLGVKLVMVTLGPKGCLLQNAQAEFSCGCPKVHPIDTTGAGDIFGGSAVWKLLQTGKAPEALDEAALREIVSFACTAAGLSTTKPGGISSVPDMPL